jgi:hypothetical protein
VTAANCLSSFWFLVYFLILVVFIGFVGFVLLDAIQSRRG